MDNPILQEEKKHLASTVKLLLESKKVLEESINSLGAGTLSKLKEFRESPEAQGADTYSFFQSLKEASQSFNLPGKFKRLEEIEFLEKEPYFSRLDLKDAGSEESYYIGKFGFTLDEPIIIDWRAKIASIYYRYRYPQKNVKYQTPDGEVVKDLTLKRTYEIDNAELIKFYNNDIQLDENEIINDKIEQRTGGVLEDIIETIQESQLDIIEADPRKICIVQGCVGSGKSTVAIHKLSHIFFNFPDLIKPERAILIAKNQILIGYLSTLFPKLGIFDINYKSLRELVYSLVFSEELKIKINFDKHDDLNKFNLDKINELRAVTDKFRDHTMAGIEAMFLRPEYSAFGGFKFSKNLSPYENLLDLVKEFEEEISMQKEYINDDPTSIKADKHRKNTRTLRKIIRDLHKIKSEIAGVELRNILKEFGINTNTELSYVETLFYVFAYAEVVGISKTRKYQYCVLDEGQDFSTLEFAVLSKIVLNGRFCILGDLNQSYAAEGLSTWDEVKQVVKEASEAVTFELSVNYRNTKQIIDFSNNILSPFTTHYLPIPINRNGSEPEIKNFSEPTDLLSEFSKELIKDCAELNKTIGIICFNDDLYQSAEKILSSIKLPEDHKIVLNSTEKIHYVQKAVYLTKFEDCKGLEFSKVYILGKDVRENKDFMSAKKSFVACTRAMNELVVYF